MSGPYLSEKHFDRIRARLADGDAVIQAAFDQLKSKADAALDFERLSVRDNGGSPFFKVDAAYAPKQDGVTNPDADFRSRQTARTFAGAACALAMAWRLTGEARYADKALMLIHAWCLDQPTKMFPTGFVQDAATPGKAYGGDIIIFSCFKDVFLAMYLLDDYEGWELNCHAAVRRWVRSMVEPQRHLMFHEGVAMYNNWEDARLLYLAMAGLFLSDLEILVEVFDRWKAIIPLKMTDEGQLPRETMRTKSMHYTLFALNSTMRVADVASAYGVDLFDYSVNGRCLKLAVDYAAGYLLDMDAWPFQMIEPLAADEKIERIGLFELACARWGDSRYLDILNAYGPRPFGDGYATLLYA